MPRAELARFVDRWTVVFVRTYPHPVDRVWRAITAPDEFGAWFIPGTIEMKVGGKYIFGGANPHITGRIEALDPPRLIRFGGDARARPGRPDGWEGGWFQYELAETSGGTRMTFTQHFPHALHSVEEPRDPGGDLPAGSPWHTGWLGGWHGFFDGLDAHLRGTTIAAELPDTEFSRLASSWLEHKVQDGDFGKDRAAQYLRELKETEDWGEMIKLYRVHIRSNCPPE
jgi:uncharacterized protein YndB with AHSA1/START domain